MIYTLKQLIQSQNTQTEINGKWVPARPLRLGGLSLKIRAAWMILTDKADAIVWPEGQ